MFVELLTRPQSFGAPSSLTASHQGCFDMALNLHRLVTAPQVVSVPMMSMIDEDESIGAFNVQSWSSRGSLHSRANPVPDEQQDVVRPSQRL